MSEWAAAGSSSRWLRAAWRRSAQALLLCCACWFLLELCRPDLLLVGNITIDLVEGTTPTGGAVSYAAVVAQELGASACVVTVAGPDADLDVFGSDARLFVVPANSTLTFEHSYAWWGHSRRLRVTANPNLTLSKAHVPWRCRFARVVLLGPLTLHDVDAASFATPQGFWERLLNRRQLVGLMAQGFQRGLGPDGEVQPLAGPSPQLLGGLSKRVQLFLSDVETDTWSQQDLSGVVSAAAQVIITEGEKGATLLVSQQDSSSSNDEIDSSSRIGSGSGFVVDSSSGSSGSSSGSGSSSSGFQRWKIPAVKVPQAVDTNGAGDTFATVWMLAMMRGDPAPDSTAAWAASRAVLSPQTCKPRCASALIIVSSAASGSAAAGGGSGIARGFIPRLGRAERVWMAAVPLLQHGAGVAARLLRQVPSGAGLVERLEAFESSTAWGGVGVGVRQQRLAA